MNARVAGPGLSVDDAAALLGAMRLSSAALPIGAFAYSQGLEQAVARGAVTDAPGAERWIVGLLESSILTLDVPVLRRVFECWGCGDAAGAGAWNDFLYAARGTRELREEDRQLGTSLYRLLESLGEPRAGALRGHPRATLPAAFALGARFFGLSAPSAALAFGYSWCEAQVGAATRLVPLGQTAAQRVLSSVQTALARGLPEALALPDDAITATAPGQALLSAEHETQYSRLFRS